MSLSAWISDATANRYRKTYFNGFVDIKDGDIIIRNGSIKTPMNTISFNDTTGFINFGNVYFGANFYVYNPTTTTNIDLVSYVNTNDDNVNYIAGQITDIYNNKIGNMYYDSVYGFNVFSNIYCYGQIQYLESGTGNHVDLVSKVLTNINDIASNTSSISTLQDKTTDISYLAGTPNTTNIANKLQTSVISFGTTLNGVSPTTFGYISTLSANAQTQLTANASNITTLQGKLTNLSFATPTTTITGTTTLSTVSFLTSLNTITPTVFGYISGLTSSAQTQISARVDKTSNETIGGIKTFSSPPVMSGASITSNTIPLASIVGTVCDLSSAQTLAGQKTFSSTPLLTANLLLNGSFLLNNNTLTITNATLQKIQYLSTVSSDVQTQLNNKIGLSNNNTYTGSNTYSGSAQFNSQFYIYSASPSIQIENGNTLRQWSNGTTGDVVMELAWDNGSASTGFSLQGGTNGTRGLFGLYFCTNVSAGTRIPIMYSKDTGTQSTNVLTIASGTTATTNITFSGTLNSVSSTTFGYLDATSSIQTQLNNKGGLSTLNTWTNSNTFNGQLTSGYNAGSALTGQGTEFFVTGQRVWEQGVGSNGDNVFELSLDTGVIRRGLSIQGGESNTAVASPSRSIFGLYYRQPQAVNGVLRTPIMYGTDTETGAINNTLVIPSSLRVDGGLLVNSGALTLTNATLQKIQYLSTVSSDVQTQLTSNTSSITTLNTKTTDISFISGEINKTKIVNYCETSNLTFLTTLNGISTTIFGYLSGLTSNIQTQLTNIVSSITTINSKLPVGMIIQHPKNNLASPYLLCNGSAISRTTYSALFTSIGTLYGVGDGSTTFNLPNYQATFLRGFGNQTIGSTTYNTASVGTAQNDTVIGHTHSGQSGQFLGTSTSTTSTNGYASIAIQKPSSSNFGTTGGVNSGGSGSETAPAHHCIYYYILAQ